METLQSIHFFRLKSKLFNCQWGVSKYEIQNEYELVTNLPKCKIVVESWNGLFLVS